MEKATSAILFRPTEVQGPIAESHTPKQTERPKKESGPATEMSSLSLCCIIEGEDIVFPIDVSAQARVSDLKKVIQLERAMDTLKGVGPHILELWKVGVSDE